MLNTRTPVATTQETAPTETTEHPVEERTEVELSISNVEFRRLSAQEIKHYVATGEPLDKDIYDLSPEEMKNVPSMPASLEEALDCLEEDHGFLMKGDVFSEELIETFIDYKRKNEADAIRLRPHPYEFAMYYDI